MIPQVPHDKNALGFFSSIPQATWVRVLIVLQLSLLAWEFYPDLSTNGDDARYYLLGQAMREGKGYRQIQLPTLGWKPDTPSLFPLLLTIVSFVSSSIMVAKIFLRCAGRLTTLLCYFLFKKSSAAAPCAHACALGGFLPHGGVQFEPHERDPLSPVFDSRPRLVRAERGRPEKRVAVLC